LRSAVLSLFPALPTNCLFCISSSSLGASPTIRMRRRPLPVTGILGLRHVFRRPHAEHFGMSVSGATLCRVLAAKKPRLLILFAPLVLIAASPHFQNCGLSGLDSSRLPPDKGCGKRDYNRNDRKGTHHTTPRHVTYLNRPPLITKRPSAISHSL
jgi:hypothetical protein